MRLLALLLFCSITAFAQAESQGYLTRSSFSIATNGSKVRTPLPLAPYTLYRIKITSPYSLKPLFDLDRGMNQSDFQVDGKFLEPISFGKYGDGHIANLEFIYRGIGKPVYLSFGSDHHSDIETAQIEIFSETMLQTIWRTKFAWYWREYKYFIYYSVVAIPMIIALGIYLIKRNKRAKAAERKAEKERQAYALNTHSKSLELLREIDRRSQQKAQEVMARNYDELQAKIMFWRTKAYTESYFLNPDLRKNFAAANREKILNELEQKWAQEFLEIAQDQRLTKALKEQEPGVLHWIQARQEVVNIAHRLTWVSNQVIDAYYEEIPNAPQIIIADDLDVEESETAANGHVKGRATGRVN